VQRREEKSGKISAQWKKSEHSELSQDEKKKKKKGTETTATTTERGKISKIFHSVPLYFPLHVHMCVRVRQC